MPIVPPVERSLGVLAGDHGDAVDDDWGCDSLGGGVRDAQLVFDPVDQLKLSILMFPRVANYLSPKPQV